MKVILKTNYPKLGYVGDTVEVKRGYARNYLLPRGIATEVSSASGKEFQHILSGVMARRTKLKGEAETMAKRMSSTALEFVLKVSEGGKGFGAITSRDIEQSLNDKGYQIDRKQIRFFESIKSAGKYSVDVKLHAEVISTVPIVVTAEGLAEKKEGKKPSKPRGGRGAKATTSETEASEE